ncbi:hypothetical protein [Caulobacter rhizosphaerae]|uniref:hypothetical protein n=1 Tax=Caulobacter rhizosphaerae TaxID=2010972 RepID=UPI0013D03C1D|nr:hypothetical protein [Caulobacter rhizosphaerae]GGL48343.1 hypothetical protein GCM10010983_52120 [Caulobacter rhizosphaerae]
MTKAPTDVAGRVVWCDRGWQPVFYGFCPSEAAWKRAVRKLGAKGDPYPAHAACCTTYSHKGQVTCLVTLGPATKHQTRVGVAGLLAHEATHVWQQVREKMGERWPSIEFEAYAVQCIFQGLYQAWLDTVAPPEMKAAGATRRKVG